MTLADATKLPITLDYRMILPPSPWVTWERVLFGVVALAIVGVLGCVVVRRLWAWWHAPEPAHVVALRRLDAIDQQRGGHDGAWLVEQVSAAVRDYLHDRFGSPAPFLTPTETAAHAMDLSGVPTPLRRWLAELAEHAGRVLYAQEADDADDADALLAAARDLVRRTHRPMKEGAPEPALSREATA